MNMTKVTSLIPATFWEPAFLKMFVEIEILTNQNQAHWYLENVLSPNVIFCLYLFFTQAAQQRLFQSEFEDTEQLCIGRFSVVSYYLLPEERKKSFVKNWDWNLVFLLSKRLLWPQNHFGLYWKNIRSGNAHLNSEEGLCSVITGLD